MHGTKSLESRRREVERQPLTKHPYALARVNRHRRRAAVNGRLAIRSRIPTGRDNPVIDPVILIDCESTTVKLLNLECSRASSNIVGFVIIPNWLNIQTPKVD